MSHLTASEVARRLGVRPRDISDLFYRRDWTNPTARLSAAEG